MKNTAYVFKLGGFSLVNQQLAIAMPQALPEFQLKWLDVADDILRRHPGTYLAATAETMMRYGRRLVSRRLPPSTFVTRSTVFLRFLPRWVERHIDPSRTAFTLQTQSLFDARRRGLPHFEYTDHTYLANHRYPQPKALLPSSARWQEMERNLYRTVVRNYTTSHFAAESIIEDYGVSSDRVKCVFSGINLPFPNEVDESHRTGQRLLFVGVDWERKGGPELFTAFQALRTEFPSLELHVVGCRPPVAGPGLIVHGRIAREEVIPHLLRADIFCLPSRAEPSAVAMVEASAYGLPVVATRVGGSVERVREGETGLLVPAGDGPALTEALRTLLRDAALRKRFGQAGRIFAQESFTWPAVVGKMAADIRSSL